MISGPASLTPPANCRVQQRELAFRPEPLPETPGAARCRLPRVRTGTACGTGYGRRPGGMGVHVGPRAGDRVEGRGLPETVGGPWATPKGGVVAGRQLSNPGHRGFAAVMGGGHSGVPGRSYVGSA